MSLHYYDWQGNYKLVAIQAGPRCFLVDESIDLNTFSSRLYHEWGYMPSITNVMLVSEEWYEEWKDLYRGKGYLMESADEGGGL